jgi:hypothetical protein
VRHKPADGGATRGKHMIGGQCEANTTTTATQQTQ